MNCTKCANPIKKGSKFCTRCGSKIQRGELSSNLKSIHNHQANNFIKPESSNLELQPELANHGSLKNKLFGFYIILVITLYLMGQGSAEMIGFSLYSVVNIVVISLRIHKPNTFNFIVKVVLILQLVFILSMIVPEASNLFINLVSTIATILFALLSLVILLMVFIGNRKKS